MDWTRGSSLGNLTIDLQMVFHAVTQEGSKVLLFNQDLGALYHWIGALRDSLKRFHLEHKSPPLSSERRRLSGTDETKNPDATGSKGPVCWWTYTAVNVQTVDTSSELASVAKLPRVLQPWTAAKLMAVLPINGRNSVIHPVLGYLVGKFNWSESDAVAKIGWSSNLKYGQAKGSKLNGGQSYSRYRGPGSNLSLGQLVQCPNCMGAIEEIMWILDKDTKCLVPREHSKDIGGANSGNFMP
ncbi:hypothetical protein B0H19DRAFT_1070131 [Mycena capillaripes]|nr:hypothetical protein B0H19DRAFT_1070131 [Mycena capillaripes]